MNRYIFLSFAVLALAFYELSGGDDFVPRKAEIMAQIEADRAAEAAAREARVTAREARPETAVTQADIRTVPASGSGTSGLVQPAVQTDEAPQATQAVLRTDEEPAPPTLISLEQSTTLFAQPLQELRNQVWIDDQTRAALQRPVTPVRQESASPPPSDIREVTGRSVNLRTGPGKGFGVITSLPRGTAVEVLGSNGDGWVELRTVGGQRVGWMAEFLLTDPQG